MPANPTVPWLSQPIKADDAGGLLVQFTKLALGGTGTAIEAPGDAANGLDVDVTRIQLPVFIDPVAVAVASVTRIAAHSAANNDVAANGNRRGVIAFNDSPQDLLIKYGAGVTTNSFTVRVKAGGYWEMPGPIFTGILSMLWESGAPTGGALITEL